MVYKYSKLLTEHFLNPRNLGKIDDFDLSVKAENSTDGDNVEFFLKFEGDRVKNVGYIIKGCPRIIAASSLTSELIKGKTKDEILDMEIVEIPKRLDIESEVFNCVTEPIKAIQKAIKRMD